MKLLMLLASLWISAPLFNAGDDALVKDEITNVSGTATYYASYFHGRRTSSGERFSNQKYTAAHRSLPFGTEVTVTNPSNGKSVVVKINDRGPHNRNFIIDLSQKAARELGIYGKGKGRVELSYKADN